jgi:hypothetical protein
MNWLFIQALWFGLAAAVIFVDRRLMDQPVGALAPDQLDAVDLKDRSAAPFLGLMLIFGGLVIPFYMWHSRRSFGAVVTGIGLMIACAVVVGIVASAIR